MRLNEFMIAFGVGLLAYWLTHRGGERRRLKKMHDKTRERRWTKS